MTVPTPMTSRKTDSIRGFISHFWKRNCKESCNYTNLYPALIQGCLQIVNFNCQVMINLLQTNFANRLPPESITELNLLYSKTLERVRSSYPSLYVLAF